MYSNVRLDDHGNFVQIELPSMLFQVAIILQIPRTVFSEPNVVTERMV